MCKKKIQLCENINKNIDTKRPYKNPKKNKTNKI